MPDDDVRARLVQLKGVGNWTVDVYLILTLHRVDVFPIGDLAAIKQSDTSRVLPRDTPVGQLRQLTQALGAAAKCGDDAGAARLLVTAPHLGLLPPVIPGSTARGVPSVTTPFVTTRPVLRDSTT